MLPRRQSALDIAIESWGGLDDWLWYPKGAWGRTIGGAPTAVPQDPDFSDVRVEANGNGQATVRWNKTGAVEVDVGVYVSTDGTTYTLAADLVAGLLSSDVLSYTVFDLLPGTRYWFKLSQDVGVSFSQPAAVVTYANVRVGSARQVRLLQAREFSPEGLVPASINATIVEQADIASRGFDDDETPCEVCSVNNAVVLDCSNCNTFRVLMSEDINSITVLGCDPCPRVQFVVPPGATYGICGWPTGCRYDGDECFTSPIVGGPLGRTLDDGYSFAGYPDSPLEQDDGPCPCKTVFPFHIQCCEDPPDCTVTCSGGSKEIKACGGAPDYRWTVVGAATIEGKRQHVSKSSRVVVKVNAQEPGVITARDVRFKVNGLLVAGVIRCQIIHDGHGYCEGIDGYPTIKGTEPRVYSSCTVISGSANTVGCVWISDNTSPPATEIQLPSYGEVTAGIAGAVVDFRLYFRDTFDSDCVTDPPDFIIRYTLAEGLSESFNANIYVPLVTTLQCDNVCGDPIVVSVTDGLGRTASEVLFAG